MSFTFYVFYVPGFSNSIKLPFPLCGTLQGSVLYYAILEFSNCEIEKMQFQNLPIPKLPNFLTPFSNSSQG